MHACTDAESENSSLELNITTLILHVILAIFCVWAFITKLCPLRAMVQPTLL